MDFIEGLKESRNIYAECPQCNFIFSLFNARLMHGKNPPKDLLAKSEKQAKIAFDKLELFQEKYDSDIDELNQKMSESVYKLKGRINLMNEEYRNNKKLLTEKIRHMKSNIAYSQKEIIKEKTELALLRSRSVIEGHIAELFPFFNKTKYNPADLCALMPTQPIDFIIFDGLFKKDVSSITFLDVKKGKAQLSQTQKQIKSVIENGNVYMKKLRVNFDNVKGNAKEES